MSAQEMKMKKHFASTDSSQVRIQLNNISTDQSS